MIVLGVTGFLAGFVVPLVLLGTPWWVQSLVMALTIMVLVLGWGGLEQRRATRR